MKVSVVIPTYTGQEHIDACLDSIISELRPVKDFEVVVVIDGPNDDLVQIVKDQSVKFEKAGIKFKTHQLTKNQGRFIARQKGAQLASCSQLLFVDDRVTLQPGFVKKICSQETVTTIPNVLESGHPNIVSRLIYLMRRRVYGKSKWGANFKTYKITPENFERAPKGTTSLWVPRTLFLSACDQVVKTTKNLKLANDDTKLLRIIMEEAGSILKRSDTVIYYHPRTSLWSELRHLYERGPRFVDYYFKRGTRFWWPVVTSLLIGSFLLVGLILYPQSRMVTLIALLSSNLILAIFLSETLTDVLVSFVGLPMVVSAFGGGVLKGLWLKIKSRL